MKILKQSTAATPGIGPFVDTAGAAATGLTLTQSDIIISKGGSTTYSAKNDSTSATHRSGGTYSVPLDTTDTATVGTLTICVNKTGSLPLKETFLVTTANVYDALVGADKLWADMVEINNVAASAVNLERSASVLRTGTSDNTGFTATNVIMETSSITEATTDHYKGRTITFTSGALLDQTTEITAYSLSGGRGRFTFSALTEAVPPGTTFSIA